MHVLAKFAASKLGIPPPPPYLSLSQDDDRLLQGVNYASGGAGILNDTGLYFVRYKFLQKHLKKFNHLHIYS